MYIHLRADILAEIFVSSGKKFCLRIKDTKKLSQMILEKKNFAVYRSTKLVCPRVSGMFRKPTFMLKTLRFRRLEIKNLSLNYAKKILSCNSEGKKGLSPGKKP